MNDRVMRQWTELAQQSMQLTWAAPQVVALRVARMMMAGPLPTTRDRREFTVMGNEKLKAFGDAGVAMTARSLALQQEYWQRWWRLWWQLALSGGWTTPGAMHQWWYDQCAHVMGGALDVASQGIRPVSRRAMANSHRLTRSAVNRVLH